MKRICRELQERLAEEGAEALRDDVAAQRHLEECFDCFRVLEGLARLDAALGAVTPIDAPEAVVSALLERVRGEAMAPAIEPERKSRFPRPVLWGLASAAVLVLAVATLTPSLMRARVAVPQATLDRYVRDRSDVAPPTTLAGKPESTIEKKENRQFEKNGAVSNEEVDKLRALGYVQSSGERASRAIGGEDRAGEKTLSLDEKIEVQTGPQKQKVEGGKADADDKRRAEVVVDGSGVEGGVAGGVVGGLSDGEAGHEQAGRFAGNSRAPRLIRRVEPTYPEAARTAGVQGEVILEIQIAATGKVEKVRVLRSVPLLDAAALEAVRQWAYAPTVVNGNAVPVFLAVTITFRLPEPPKKPGSSDNLSTEPARAFLAERSGLEGVEFQLPGGYWANTYVPGDPTLRLLQARLAAWDSSALQVRAGIPLRLHEAAAEPSQPFDPPRDAALAVYLHADRRGLDGPGRMLVQVGLKGAARAGGRRPALNVALVLDLRGDVAVETATGMRALALALSRAREAGDRFSLVVAGRPGGVAVAPAEFKHGPLTVALDRLLTDQPSARGLGLADAVAAAYREVSRCDDPEAPLGSSAVVLATGQALEETGTLADLAHQGAVAGIPLSVIALGGGVSLGELDRLVLAGQGRRGVLETPSDAARVVDAELLAAGGAVARAVRLRIRLAPGVRLVDVVGSRRLDEAQAERVREAERSIDLDLARKLGIESDRGEDEDGIQIVIPSFQAGDAHAILLDVVAPGPGPIADVGVRYKDLLSLRNGTARASLALSRDMTAPGPLERNVVANLLAFHVSRALACAGDALAAGDVSGASASIEHARALLAGVGVLVPSLAGDPALLRDAGMLGEYADLLASGALGTSERPRVADSLRYAARLKLLPRPAPLAVAAL